MCQYYKQKVCKTVQLSTVKIVELLSVLQCQKGTFKLKI